VLGEDHDAAARQHLPHRVREVDALRRVRRRHPDVGDEDVWAGTPGQLERLGRVTRVAEHDDVGLVLEQPSEALARDEVVVHDENLHGAVHPSEHDGRHRPGQRDRRRFSRRHPEGWSACPSQRGRTTIGA
jgi:hypothetical protein